MSDVKAADRELDLRDSEYFQAVARNSLKVFHLVIERLLVVAYADSNFRTNNCYWRPSVDKDRRVLEAVYHRWHTDKLPALVIGRFLWRRSSNRVDTICRVSNGSRIVIRLRVLFFCAVAFLRHSVDAICKASSLTA